MPIALITGASKGFGRAVTYALAERGWTLIVDARGEGELRSATQGLADVTAIAGDVTDPDHRIRLAQAVPGGVIVNVSSDAAVEAYPGWGGYGSAKAALDQLTNVLGIEEPRLRCYAFDPGDMRTEMHQLAFPGEDISDRPEPRTVVPALLRLLETRPPSGRYRAADLAMSEVAR